MNLLYSTCLATGERDTPCCELTSTTRHDPNTTDQSHLEIPNCVLRNARKDEIK